MPKPVKKPDTLLHPKARVLVTGAAGFIGSALVHALNQRGVTDIVVTDFLGEDERWRNLAPLEFEDFVPADKLLPDLAKDPEYYGMFSACFHLGACSSTTVTDAEYVMENNYAYTKTLCKWAMSQGRGSFTPPAQRLTVTDRPAWMTRRRTSARTVR